jgi:AraC-like DNA-binding protein
LKLVIEERPSDSPFVERVWQSYSDEINTFTSIAANHLELVVWKYQGQTSVALRGPETKATTVPVPQYAEFFGIIFKLGAFMPDLPPVSELVDGDVPLPGASSQSFWLKGSAWQLPSYENAETFVNRLVRDGLLAREPVVDTVVRGHQPDMSLRSIQRRFLRATGLTYRTMAQTERARRAALLLRGGTSILDTVHELGYFDQSHLTNSLKHYIGQTPAQLMDNRKTEQLSLLYKTDSFR